MSEEPLQAEALKQERTLSGVSQGPVVREKVGLGEFPGVRQVLQDLTGHADDYLYSKYDGKLHIGTRLTLASLKKRL